MSIDQTARPIDMYNNSDLLIGDVISSAGTKDPFAMSYFYLLGHIKITNSAEFMTLIVVISKFSSFDMSY